MIIEVGKVYRSRDGRKVEALKETDDGRVLCYYNSYVNKPKSMSWAAVNKSGMFDKIHESCAELIAEWRELYKEEFYIQESYADKDFKFGGKEWMNFKSNNWSRHYSKPTGKHGRIFKITIEEQE